MESVKSIKFAIEEKEAEYDRVYQKELFEARQRLKKQGLTEAYLSKDKDRIKNLALQSKELIRLDNEKRELKKKLHEAESSILAITPREIAIREMNNIMFEESPMVEIFLLIEENHEVVVSDLLEYSSGINHDDKKLWDEMFWKEFGAELLQTQTIVVENEIRLRQMLRYISKRNKEAISEIKTLLSNFETQKYHIKDMINYVRNQSF